MIKFGTSGFRGIIGDNWTKQNIQKIGFALRALAKSEGKNSRMIVGYDNRFMGKQSSEWFCEAACCESLKAVVYRKPVPSPLITFRANDFDFGIMFTASHNPYFYNGIKIFLRGGKEADEAFIAKLMKQIELLRNNHDTSLVELAAKGIVEYCEDISMYGDKVISLVDADKIRKSDIKVLFNPMHGSSVEVCEDIFKRLGIKYEIINGNADPYFGNAVPAPYAYRLKDMSKKVQKGNFSFGFALDGDADRVAFIDVDGKFYDCNYLTAIFYYYYIEVKKRKGTLVKNHMTSALATKLCKKYGVQIHETRPGFKFLGAVLERDDVLIAGESGGIAFKEVSMMKDGIFSAFALIDLLVNTKKSIGKILEEIIDQVQFPTVCVEYAYVFESRMREKLEKKLSNGILPKFERSVKGVEIFPDGFKATFDDDYWVAARMSGNEDVVRFYSECATEAEGERCIKQLEEYYNLHERQG